MNCKAHLGWVLLLGACNGMCTDATDTVQEFSADVCSQQVDARDVLVLVLKTGPYLGKQRSARFKRVKDGGYALVVMGQRTYR